MLPRQPVPASVLALAMAQGGVVSREQAMACGLTRATISRLVTTGWTPLARGIYQTSPGPVDWLGLCWAGLLLGGDASRLGPHASGYLHGLLDDPPSPVDVLVPQDRPCRVTGPWTFIRERAGVRDPRTFGAPPRISVADTVLDLGGSGSEADLVGLVTRAVQRRRTTVSALSLGLDRRRRHPHRLVLHELLTDVAEGVESGLELHYLRKVERAHGLPNGNRQRSRLGLRHRSDVGYDDYQVLVELDGRAGHEADGRFRDMARDNQFALSTWLTLRYGWFDVLDHPCRVAYQVGSVLVRRGWRGTPTRCRNCQAADHEDLVG